MHIRLQKLDKDGWVQRAATLSFYGTGRSCNRPGDFWNAFQIRCNTIEAHCCEEFLARPRCHPTLPGLKPNM